jgi:hypothetical protein
MKVLDGQEFDDAVEEIIYKTARQMTLPGGTYSIKTTRESGGGAIPVDTGRLKAVFGAIDGKPNTGYIRDHARAEAKSDTTYEEDVIWEKNSKFQRTIGTSLHYAATVQRRIDFVGAYLRTKLGVLNKYIQRQFNTFVKDMGEKYGFK